MFFLSPYRAIKLRNNYWGTYVIFYFWKSINIPHHYCVYVNVIFSRFIMWVIPASPNHFLLPGIYIFFKWTGEMCCCASSEYKSCGLVLVLVLTKSPVSYYVPSALLYVSICNAWINVDRNSIIFSAEQAY